ncbi:MAG: hypothetical protein WA797_06155, partial [Acidimicrobiales bacterium]
LEDCSTQTKPFVAIFKKYVQHEGKSWTNVSHETLVHDFPSGCTYFLKIATKGLVCVLQSSSVPNCV